MESYGKPIFEDGEFIHMGLIYLSFVSITYVRATPKAEHVRFGSVSE